MVRYAQERMKWTREEISTRQSCRDGLGSKELENNSTIFLTLAKKRVSHCCISFSTTVICTFCIFLTISSAELFSKRLTVPSKSQQYGISERESEREAIFHTEILDSRNTIDSRNLCNCCIIPGSVLFMR